ncbi:MAG TPA: hypothetical protein VE177_01090, partial [Candidatus Binatus sp.]|nr:hypothetical protein [Candidatus Binatus sp.]
MSKRPGLVVPDENAPLNVSVLEKYRTKGFRTGVWHRALNPIEKGLVKCVIFEKTRKPIVRCSSLVKQLVAIISKISNAMGRRIQDALKAGLELVEELSGLAVSWGNQAAIDWLSDQG